METTVTLQAPFEYDLWVIILGIVLIALSLLLFVRIIISIRKREKKSRIIPEYKPATPMEVYGARDRAISRIQRIMDDFREKRITKREGYQKLSLVIRSFVHDTTGINVEVRTLEEIKTLGMPGLNALIEEYYMPEFAEDGKADNTGLWASCNKTIGVIQAWR
ncbi:MAG: hypothetical protein IK152_03210 [Lachnospiraceae bacterium]|nr:hypothetical protein [Lachnospiraceae bacterium]